MSQQAGPSWVPHPLSVAARDCVARVRRPFLFQDTEDRDESCYVQEGRGAALAALAAQTADDWVPRPDRMGHMSRDGYYDAVLDVQRVSKTTAAGRRSRFRVVVAIGNRAGRVGVAHASSREVPDAVSKARRAARRALVEVRAAAGGTLEHVVEGRHGAARVVLRPAREGTGILAGAGVRAILELAGLRNALGKQMRSFNPWNNARATVEALGGLVDPEELAKMRGMPVREFRDAVPPAKPRLPRARDRASASAWFARLWDGPAAAEAAA